MLDFAYDISPRRVVFRHGALATIAGEVDRLGRRSLILSTPDQAGLARDVAELLGNRAVGVFDGAVMHVPIEVARMARRQAVEQRIDCCIAIGGGSTIGLAKAIALEHDVAVIAVPTTYAGSEMTPIWGLTEDGVKRTGRDSRVLPRTTIYDPALTIALPPALSVSSGLNAIAHCVEALYADNGNPVISLMAEEGIRALASSLPKILLDSLSLEARSKALYGAWLAGTCLGAVSMALHHKLCHTLGGTFNLPHAQTHAVMLPYAAAFNAPSAPDAMARVARALGSASAATGLQALGQQLGAPQSLSAIGFHLADIDRAVALAVAAPYPNPRAFSEQDIRELLTAATVGAPVEQIR